MKDNKEKFIYARKKGKIGFRAIIPSRKESNKDARYIWILL
jgi:hypothetical protein